jgi:carboxymethylenebutenolidase
VEYISKLPASNGKVACAGYCWGGGQALRFATNNKDIKASMVFYGSSKLEKADVEKINCPVYGFYGENDARINMTIPDLKKMMADNKKTYEPIEYKGAGHGFLRMGGDPKGKDENKTGRDDAWKRMKEILKKI